MPVDDIDFPRVKTGSDKVEKYKELIESEWSPFLGYDYWQVFIFSMSYAYAKKYSPKTVPGGAGNMPASVFKTNTRDLMRALAVVHTDDLNIIKDSRDYVKICEEFAYAGFDELYKIIINSPPTERKEDILMNIIKGISEDRD